MKRDLILIVDDNEDIRLLLRATLEEEGFDVVDAINGVEAISIFSDSRPALIILDLLIGQPDGFVVCNEIRKISSVPIIILTSRRGEVDEAMSLAAGADDFITKPFSPRILALRVKTQLRHRVQQQDPIENFLKSGVLELNLESHEFTVNGAVVALTRTEYEILKLLMLNPKKVFTRAQIMEAIDGSLIFSSDHLLDTHASRLRQKVKFAGGPKIVHAIRGVGFCLQNFNDPNKTPQPK